MKSCSVSFPRAQMPHSWSPSWSPFRGCWRLTAAVATELILVEGDGQWQFFIHKVKPGRQSFDNGLCCVFKTGAALFYRRSEAAWLSPGIRAQGLELKGLIDMESKGVFCYTKSSTMKFFQYLFLTLTHFSNHFKWKWSVLSNLLQIPFYCKWMGEKRKQIYWVKWYSELRKHNR